MRSLKTEYEASSARPAAGYAASSRAAGLARSSGAFWALVVWLGAALITIRDFHAQDIVDRLDDFFRLQGLS